MRGGGGGGGLCCFFLPPGTKPWGQTGKGVVRNKWMKGQREEEEEQDSACHK